MAVETVDEIYKCKMCGDEVGGSVLVCCSQDMDKTGLKTPDVLIPPGPGC